ncbi:unnamed protein product [Rhizoctonia solani]|uniref:Uncharacterized protein n=1 Tax=Rhizoctonia solani TaxID=456999 RepID=A0A8H3C940_9AGAM|nr:unnamed protein product [Rhizoctonia solani]
MNVQESQLQRSISDVPSIKSGKINQEQEEGQETVAEHVKSRPPLDYSSFGKFWESVGVRLRSVLTRRFVLALLGGQLVSICITCTSVTTTELVNHGFKGWGKVIIKDGWKYFILAASDVEGNYLVVKAYAYTNLLSCMLLDSWAIPACAFFAWIYMRPKYHWTQLIVSNLPNSHFPAAYARPILKFGILICVGGLGMLVASDRLTGTGQYPASSMVKGDLFMLAGATLSSWLENVHFTKS